VDRHAPKILVFDSGLGGLTVLAQVTKLRPDAHCLYVADDAGFPYGRLSATRLIERVNEVMERLIARYEPDAVVVACNTASTLVLPHLRANFPKIPFIGTVPAIKPAAGFSQSKMISVLATPGTVSRDYTRDLVRTYAAHCDVTLVGSDCLADLAEAFMKGEKIADAVIAAEIAPCFVSDGDRRTDCIVLACTHYPLLLEVFERVAPWPVEWIDPAEAIARRVDHVLREELAMPPNLDHASERTGVRQHVALFTSPGPTGPALEAALAKYGLGKILHEAMPLDAQ
jgi:glutamate racemase